MSSHVNAANSPPIISNLAQVPPTIGKTPWGLILALGLMIGFIGFGAYVLPDISQDQGDVWHGNSAGSAHTGQ